MSRVLISKIPPGSLMRSRYLQRTRISKTSLQQWLGNQRVTVCLSDHSNTFTNDYLEYTVAEILHNNDASCSLRSVSLKA